MTETWKLDATALSDLLTEGKVTPRALLEQSLARLDRFEPTLNCFTHVDRAGALASAEAATQRQAAGRRIGPLDDIPISIKDNLLVEGMPARWGSLLFRDNIPPQDDICVERLRAAGAVIIGKTTTPEFALMGRTESRLSGITRNPWDPKLTPGGSSGGAVASVAVGVTPLSIGTDAGGSARMPAAYTGLMGMRPSTGRIARRFGFPPMAIDFQSIGPFTRTMRDMRLVYDLLAGPDARDPLSQRFPADPSARQDQRLRVGWLTAIGDESATPEVATTIADAVERLGASGCTIEPATAPFDLKELRNLWGTLTAAGAARVAAKFPDRWRADLTTSVRDTAERGFALPASAYVNALDTLAAWRANVTETWARAGWDALVMPATAAPAWVAEDDAPPNLSVATQHMFCGWVNAIGYSGISVPGLPHPDGRPIGVQIVAPFGADAVVLELARRLEETLPWSDRWPTMAL